MKRKQLILTLVVVLLIGMLCACAGPEVTPSGSDSTPAEPSSTYKDMLIGTSFDPDDMTTWYSDTPAFPAAEDIAKIQPGMTLTEVVHIIGLPQRDVGSGRFILEWELNSDNILRIVFERKIGAEDLPLADSLLIEKIESTETSK